jgi:ATP synthase protein I
VVVWGLTGQNTVSKVATRFGTISAEREDHPSVHLMSEGKHLKPLDDLNVRLSKAQAEQIPPIRDGITSQGGSMSGFGVAMRIGVELIAALIVGVGIGLLLDRFLETAPLFLVVFFFLGAGAGIMNVYRAASGLGLAAGYARLPENVDDDGDGTKGRT